MNMTFGPSLWFKRSVSGGAHTFAFEASLLNHSPIKTADYFFTGGVIFFSGVSTLIFCSISLPI
jgi:hypothetical protein